MLLILKIMQMIFRKDTEGFFKPKFTFRIVSVIFSQTNTNHQLKNTIHDASKDQTSL
jgi:hypothetical protein